METLSKGYKKFEGTDIVENAFNAINDNAIKTNTLEETVEGKEGALATDRKRKITISTSSPSGGSDGDIWIKI